MNVICDYCQQPALLVGGNWIYPNRPDLAHKRFWFCGEDGAWVGCHGDSDRPLGRLANYELRQARVDAHATFDPLWKSGSLRRGEAYAWLASQLGVSIVHIGEMNVDECRRVVQVCATREGRE